MGEEEAKEIIRNHLCRVVSNTKQLIDAINVAIDILGQDATIDEVCEWAKK